MDWAENLLLLMGCASLLLLMGLPVAFAFLTINVVGAFIFMGGMAGLDQLARNSMASVATFSLTPIPLFVLMGEVLFQTGLAFKVIDGIERLILSLNGRLAVVSVVAGTVFSAISGSTIATTAMLGGTLTPAMLKRGYHPSLAMGPVMAIGGVDMLIPPSALTVLLGSLAGISITKLLFGGIVPGILLSAVFVMYIVVRVSLNRSLAPSDDIADYHGWDRFRSFFVYVLPLVLIFGVVVGAMSTGIATPTESAALGAMATVIFAAAYRALTFKNLLAALKGTLAISGMVLFIIVGATTFAQILGFSGATNGLVKLLLGHGFSPFTMVVGMMLILLVLGCFVDQVSMMLLTLPFFMPIVQSMGIDPVWFGVLFLIAMQLGLLSPPFGLLVFTMKSVAPPDITLAQVFRAVTPYVLIGLGMLIAILFIPGIATWLPGLLG
ncbi:MAG: fcbT3 [Noviherbaspirillum sp.]|nr:fcbT3 [Noviherbaspirillum sp.]